MFQQRDLKSHALGPTQTKEKSTNNSSKKKKKGRSNSFVDVFFVVNPHLTRWCRHPCSTKDSWKTLCSFCLWINAEIDSIVVLNTLTPTQAAADGTENRFLLENAKTQISTTSENKNTHPGLSLHFYVKVVIWNRYTEIHLKHRCWRPEGFSFN